MQDIARVRSSQPLGPEPYAGSGDAPGVAWGRGTCRPAIELRNQPFRVPTLSNRGEGNTRHRAMASDVAARRSRRPCACMETPSARTGRSHASPPCGGAVGECLRPYDQHERVWEVRWSHSTYEAGEQNRNPGAESAEERGSPKGKALNTARYGLSAGNGEDGCEWPTTGRDSVILIAIPEGRAV